MNQYNRFIAAAWGASIGMAMVYLCVYLLGNYGAVLFMLTPLIATSFSAWLYNRGAVESYRATFLTSFLTLMLPACFLFVLGLEGLFCIAMALLPATALAIIGALIGRLAARWTSTRCSHAFVVLALLPLLAGAEASVATPTLNEVITTIEIDAPPEAVWPQVIGYSALPAPEQWYFRAGIGYPQQVQMAGAGVGATRYCDFSTGSYVEPITHWEPPYRLTFDVTKNPPAMRELSFYEHVDAPHLMQTPRNRRGEFRLTRLPGARTRLAGSTWYEIEMYPQFYWRRWANGFVRRIHERVFEHLKQQAEAAYRADCP